MSPRLRSINIRDFRSIRGQINVPLDAPVVLIHGPNGVGKTSILSALELGLTGAIPSLGRVEPDYKSFLVHKQADRAEISVELSGLPNIPTSSSMEITRAGLKGEPLLPVPLSHFYSERCYLPQSVLGRLLELYQASDARKSDSPLTEFVKELLGISQLDAIIDGLHDAGDIRRLRTPVPVYAEVRAEMETQDRAIRADQAELDELIKVIGLAEAGLSEALLACDPRLIEKISDRAFLQKELASNAEQEPLSLLARLRRDLEATSNEWQSLSTSTASDQRVQSEAEAKESEKKVLDWRANEGRQLEDIITKLSDFFPSLPSSLGTDPEFARTTCLRSVEREIARCNELVTQYEADIKRVSDLDQEALALSARELALDQQLAQLASDSGALAQALAQLVPHVHSDDCPVCGRDFSEVSRQPLAAHLSGRIAALTENAGRLQSLSLEKSTTATSLVRLKRERSNINGRLISDKSLNEIKTRRARLEDARQKLSALADAAKTGLSYINAAGDKARALDVLRNRDQRVTNFREGLRNLAQRLGIKEIDLNVAPASLLTTFRTFIAQQEGVLTGRQASRRQAATELSSVATLGARREAILKGIAERRTKLNRLAVAKEEADRRIAKARTLAHKAREIRTSIVRRVFNDNLNLVWRDLFVRLAPEEPFVPAFAIPTNAEGPVEALLETIYKAGGKGGNPRAMLSAGNLNTAALTLFLSLHLSVFPLLPWLIIDDPVQSMDEVHIAQFSALLRTLSKSHGRQIILAVHEKSLFDYLALELSPAYSDDRLITIELGQSSEGQTVCKYEPLTWSPDPAFEAVA